MLPLQKYCPEPLSLYSPLIHVSPHSLSLENMK